MDPIELRRSLKESYNLDWDPQKLGDLLARQVVYIGIYDGYAVQDILIRSRLIVLRRHGGSAVSQFLRQELHGLLESVDKAAIPELFSWVKEIGGYFKRFKGGALEPWINNATEAGPLTLEARATQAFFEVRTLFIS